MIKTEPRVSPGREINVSTERTKIDFCLNSRLYYFLPLSGKETGKPILAREIPGSGPECRSESSDRACSIAKISYFAEWLELIMLQ